MIATLLLIANNETGNQFNPIKLSKNKCHSYKGGGIFQLTNNHTKTHIHCDNIVSGEDRHNLYKLIPALVKRLEFSREMIENQRGRWCDSWYYTRIHNPGLRHGERLAKPYQRALYRRTVNDVKNNKWGVVVNKIINEILYIEIAEMIEKIMSELKQEEPNLVIKDKTNVKIWEIN